jgi:predicted anti-sigma-YlaC factor YlaD
MKCKKTEKLLIRSFDRPLQKKEKEELEAHLKTCSACRKMRIEYKGIQVALRGNEYPEHKPYFWERLQPKLKEKRAPLPWAVWNRWGIRAIPLSLLFIVAIATLITSLFIPQQEELSQSGILLIHNQNPFEETRSILEEEEAEDSGMLLIFASIDERNPSRRQFP